MLCKSCLYNGDCCLKHHNFCQDDPLSSQTPILDFEDGGHLDGENDTLEIQVTQFSKHSFRKGSGKVQGRFREGSGKV